MPKDVDEVMNRIEEIDDTWDDLEKGGFVRFCLSSVRGCCFALGLKELLGFGNDRAYYSLRDTWRDD